MLNRCIGVLAGAGALWVGQLQGSTYADAVVAYDPGTGCAPGYTDAAAALGEPSRVNPFGEGTDPFNPPYGPGQVVSIGAGGWLVAYFHTPVLNHPNNLRGLDFILFGNAGFIITNDFDPATFSWVGIPATDGTLFGNNPGVTRVSVSRDGVMFYLLDPVRAPTLDNLFPTDGGGDFQVPVDPALTEADFAGATLADIRVAYQTSGGGAGYDIAWAVDAWGRPVHLPEIHFIRIDVIAGKVELDGVAAVARAGRGHGRK